LRCQGALKARIGTFSIFRPVSGAATPSIRCDCRGAGIDYGINTAPGCPTRAEVEQVMKAKCLRSDPDKLATIHIRAGARSAEASGAGIGVQR